MDSMRYSQRVFTVHSSLLVMVYISHIFLAFSHICASIEYSLCCLPTQNFHPPPSQAVEISREDYVPSDMDILYAEGITTSNGLACTEFSFPKSAQADDYIDVYDQNDDSVR